MEKQLISVLRRMTVGSSHVPTWVRVCSGFSTVEQAKVAAVRQAYSTHFDSHWRVIDRVGLNATCQEAHVKARRRTAEWAIVEPEEYYARLDSRGRVEVALADTPDVIPGWTRVKAYFMLDAQYVASLELSGKHG